MDVMKLPIDVVPNNTNQLTFRWRTVGVGSIPPQDCEGMLPPPIERAVADLVVIAKQALMDNAMLRGQVEAMTNRLNKEDERIAETPTPPSPTPAPQPTSTAPGPRTLTRSVKER